MKTELTKEQSEHLIELGVSEYRASTVLAEGSAPTPTGSVIGPTSIKPIFTLTDILSILPKEIGDHCLSIDATDTCYNTAYAEWDEDENWEAVIRHILFEVIAPELIDSLYQLLIWTIENGYVKTDKK